MSGLSSIRGIVTESRFRAAWWLPGAHLQTLFAQGFRRRRPPPLRRERLELDDGDFLDLDWTPARTGPLVVLLHGLEGSRHSHYAAGLMQSLHRRGLQVVLLNFRGCSGEPNRLTRSYHSGETADFSTLLQRLRARDPRRVLYAVGVSLGGNVLLKWLGENPVQTSVARAIAVSVPFELDKAAHRLRRGLSRAYEYYLLRKLQAKIRAKSALMPLPIRLDGLSRLNSFHRFDDAVTAPLHGFNGVDDYYRQSSCRAYLSRILTPTVILQARDDPFLSADAIPRCDELGAGVRLELSRHGGHVGFVAGRWPWRPCYWLDHRIGEILATPT